MTNADVSKQWKSQEKIKNQSKNATNKLISEEAYKSDIWVTTSIGFEYSYSLIHTILFYLLPRSRERALHYIVP